MFLAVDLSHIRFLFAVCIQFSRGLSCLNMPDTPQSGGKTSDSSNPPIPTPNPTLQGLFNSLAGTASDGEMSAISLKLPPFWPKLPVEWFHQVEALFATRSITSQTTKFNHVLTVLPCEVITDVLDVIDYDRVQVTDPYDQLKQALLSRLIKSESRRLEELLNGTPMGDRTPSEYFRHLKALAGSSRSVNDELLQKLWIRNLPVVVQTAVTASGKPDTTAMAKVADDVYEVYQRQANFAHSSAGTGISELVVQNQQLLAEVAALKKSVAEMRGRERSRSRSRGRSPNRYRNRSRSDSGDSDGKCWYHATYGDLARKCRQPCTASSSGSASGPSSASNRPN